MRNLCAQAEALCRVVAPDVAIGPLYVVLLTDLPPEYRNGDDFDGCTLRHLDLVLQPELKRLGRWCGRGPAMILDPQRIAAAEARRPTMSRRRAFPTSTFGVVMHELAHIIDIGPDDPNPRGEMIKAGHSLLTTEVSEASTPTNWPNASIPWHWHEWSFIRTAMHLAHQAIKHGYGLSPTDVFDASDYKLSPTRKYLAALGDEPERMAGSDFVSINKSTPPTAFTDLWLADMEAWASGFPNSEEFSKALARCGHRISIP